MNKEIVLNNKVISNHSKTYIVAEMSSNHLMDKNRAKQIIKAVCEAGADAIKLQTYTPNTITLNSDAPQFKKTKGLWAGETLYSLYQKAYTPWEWHEELKAYANSMGLDCFSSPFDMTAVDFMEQLNMPAYKIASLELLDIPMIKKIALLGKPMILSTGIAHLEDIERALSICEEAGNQDVILMKCTSAYPCPYEDINLKAIPLMKKTFNCIVGLSDHTLGCEAALGSVALGAKVIEKHVTLRREDGGPDSTFSMEPEEFRDMVIQIRNLEKALGHASFQLTEKQEETRRGGRSLYVIKDMEKGERFTADNVRSIRPGGGLHPMYYEDILGKTARKNIKKATPLSWNLLE